MFSGSVYLVVSTVCSSGLCFCSFLATGNDLLLASGSQDVYIRLWRIKLDNEKVDAGGSLVMEEQSFSSQNQSMIH